MIDGLSEGGEIDALGLPDATLKLDDDILKVISGDDTSTLTLGGSPLSAYGWSPPTTTTAAR